MCPKTDVKLLKTTQTESMNEQSSDQHQKIVDEIEVTSENDISYELQKSNLPTEQASKTIKDSLNHEILWHLEFDGSVNKLGAGAGV